MKTFWALLALFALVTLPITVAPNDKIDVMSYAQVFGPRVAPPPHYIPGEIFNSQGGYIAEFRGLREKMRRVRGPIRLGNCGSACTMLLSLPNACVYPGARYTFHAARRNPSTIDMDGTNEMFRHVPAPIRGLLRPPFDGMDQILTGGQLIASGGARPCPY